VGWGSFPLSLPFPFYHSSFLIPSPYLSPLLLPHSLPTLSPYNDILYYIIYNIIFYFYTRNPSRAIQHTSQIIEIAGTQFDQRKGKKKWRKERGKKRDEEKERDM
jgi:hypothetical protein